MIGTTVEMNDSIYLKVPIAMEAINQNKYEMLQYNNIKGIINFNRRYFNDACYLTYNLDTYISLRTLEKQNGLQDNLLIEILSQINEIILSLETFFLLESKDFVLTMDNIYYDYHKKDVQLIYLPKDNHESLHSKYKLFLMNLAAGMPLERKHSLLMNALKGFIQKEAFSIQGLNDLIKNQVLGESKEMMQEKISDEDLFFTNSKTLSDPIEKETVKTKASKEVLIGDIFRGIALEAIGLLTMNLLIKYFGITDQLNQIGIILLVQLLTGLIIYLVVLKEYYGFDQLKAYFKSKSDYERKASTQENVFASTNHLTEGVGEKEIIYNTSTAIEGMIEEVYPSKAYLLRKDLKSEEKIYITEKNFVLGRQVEATDYHIDDSKISKRHLEILDIDDELFIRDLNSTNGTYLNEEKLETNRLTKVFDGDLIKMAALVYEFKIE